MTLNLQPGAPKAHQKEVDRTHISLTKGKSSETLTAVTCVMPLCLSALVQRQTGPAQWFSNFFSLAVELFHYATCFVDAELVTKIKAELLRLGSRAPFPPTLLTICRLPTLQPNPKAPLGVSQAQGSTA